MAALISISYKSEKQRYIVYGSKTIKQQTITKANTHPLKCKDGVRDIKKYVQYTKLFYNVSIQNTSYLNLMYKHTFVTSIATPVVQLTPPLNALSMLEYLLETIVRTRRRSKLNRPYR